MSIELEFWAVQWDHFSSNRLILSAIFVQGAHAQWQLTEAASTPRSGRLAFDVDQLLGDVRCSTTHALDTGNCAPHRNCAMEPHPEG